MGTQTCFSGRADRADFAKAEAALKLLEGTAIEM
jgi:hypothetical protein